MFDQNIPNGQETTGFGMKRSRVRLLGITDRFQDFYKYWAWSYQQIIRKSPQNLNPPIFPQKSDKFSEKFWCS